MHSTKCALFVTQITYIHQWMDFFGLRIGYIRADEIKRMARKNSKSIYLLIINCNIFFLSLSVIFMCFVETIKTLRCVICCHSLSHVLVRSKLTNLCFCELDIARKWHVIRHTVEPWTASNPKHNNRCIHKIYYHWLINRNTKNGYLDLVQNWTEMRNRAPTERGYELWISNGLRYTK